MQLLVPILGGLLLGYWLHRQFGVSPVWTVVLAVLGMFAGLGIMYKRLMFSDLYKQAGEQPPETPAATPDSHHPKLPWEEDGFTLDDDENTDDPWKDDDFDDDKDEPLWPR